MKPKLSYTPGKLYSMVITTPGGFTKLKPSEYLGGILASTTSLPTRPTGRIPDPCIFSNHEIYLLDTANVPLLFINTHLTTNLHEPTTLYYQFLVFNKIIYIRDRLLENLNHFHLHLKELT